jgi:hypothetical protein
MTNNTTSNTSTNHIHAIFHKSIIHSYGGIHMSPFKEPLSLDDFTTDDEEQIKTKIKTKHTDTEDIFHHLGQDDPFPNMEGLNYH